MDGCREVWWGGGMVEGVSCWLASWVGGYCLDALLAGWLAGLSAV